MASSHLSKKPHTRKCLCEHGVQGKRVVFFGTPFRGSVVANRMLIFKELGNTSNCIMLSWFRALKTAFQGAGRYSDCFQPGRGKFRIKPIIYYETAIPKLAQSCKSSILWLVLCLQIAYILQVGANLLRGLSPLRPNRRCQPHADDQIL